MSNYTVDDVASTLVYGPGWGVAAVTDPALSQYFQSTYHASMTAGASVSVTFSGSGIFVYGSRGPDRGPYSVRCDSTVELLTAKADALQYQQLLFAATGLASSANHSVTLTTTAARWVDVDYITVTAAGSAPSRAFSSTIPPPPAPSSTGTSASATLSPAQATSSVTTASTVSDSVTRILAIIFGTLLLFFCLAACAYFLRRRRRHTGSTPPKVESERTLPASLGAEQAVFHISPGACSASGHSHSMSAPHSKPSNPHSDPRALPASPSNSVPSNPYTDPRPVPSPPAHASLQPVLTATTSEAAEMRQWGHARQWSPFAVPLRSLFVGAKEEGADSMKSTFLKV